MAFNNKKFGVVNTTASNLLDNINNLQDGKLYFVAGDSSGVVKQGIYGVSEYQDANGLITSQVSLFGTGGVADGNGYGLSQENFTTAFKTKLDGIDEGANKYVHPESGVWGDEYGDLAGPRTLSRNSSTFTVVSFEVNDYGHITSVSDVPITLPKSAFSDESVTSVDNHYSPVANDASKINVTAGKYITALTRDAAGHIVGFSEDTLPKVSDATHADSADNASTAETANKVAQSFDISAGGANILSFNGSTNRVLSFNGGTNINISNSNGTLTFATTDVPTNDEMNQAISTAMGNLAGALLYKGTVASANNLPENASTGWVYVASASFVYNDGANDWVVESGDMFIYNGSKWNIVTGENQVENKNATLNPGDSNVVIATVDGTDIKVNIPALNAGVNSLNDQTGILTTSYDGSILASTENSYRAGTLTIAGKEHVLYCKDTVYVHPESGVWGDEYGDLAGPRTLSRNSSTFTVVSFEVNDYGHITSVSDVPITLPKSAFSDTTCTTATLNIDSSVETPSTEYVDVVSNVAISMNGDGSSLSGNMTAVKVATEVAISNAIEEATIYWEVL